MDDLDARLKVLADPVRHAEQMAQMDDTLARLDRTKADLEAMIDRAKTLPSLPELARALDALTAEVGRLRERVATLEAECCALREGELLRFWEDEDVG